MWDRSLDSDIPFRRDRVRWTQMGKGAGPCAGGKMTGGGNCHLLPGGLGAVGAGVGVRPPAEKLGALLFRGGAHAPGAVVRRRGGRPLGVERAGPSRTQAAPTGSSSAAKRGLSPGSGTRTSPTTAGTGTTSTPGTTTAWPGTWTSGSTTPFWSTSPCSPKSGGS